jgi:DNA-binding response OmpR family regulator
MKTVLIVDDEPDIRRGLRTALEADGYSVKEASDAAAARASLEKALPDLILLDIRLPGEDGFAFCRDLRSQPGWKALPVIFLTSGGQQSQKILGFELGADDYVVKPFSVPELLARVKAVIRRRSGELEEGIISDGAVTLNVPGRTLKVGGISVNLTAKEFDLLRLLMQKAGRVLSRNYLMETIWGREYEQSTRTIDQHVYLLRKALGKPGKRIVSVGTAGYKWEEE